MFTFIAKHVLGNPRWDVGIERKAGKVAGLPPNRYSWCGLVLFCLFLAHNVETELGLGGKSLLTTNQIETMGLFQLRWTYFPILVMYIS